MTTNKAFEIRSGCSHTLGANYDGEGVNFAIFPPCRNASSFVFTIRAGSVKSARLELPEYTDEIWHGYVEVAARRAVWVPRLRSYDPENGHRFNPNKRLLTLMPVSWWAIFSGTCAFRVSITS